jgi:uncharacterized protein YdhG (YjbR/CyaY superfamily)
VLEKEQNIEGIDQYLALQPVQMAEKLQQIRQIIRNVVPEATESFSYQMPSFDFHGKLAYYAVFKEHYSLFVMPDVLKVFKDKLKNYSLSKSAIRIPSGDPVPEALIREIVAFAAQSNLEKKRIKDEMKKKR